MKSLALSLTLCAALTGCAVYDTPGYGSYSAYPAAYTAYPPYPAYPAAYPVYPYQPYGYGWSNPGLAYGGPTVNLSVHGSGSRGSNGHEHNWQRSDHDARGRGDRATPHGPRTNAMGAGAAPLDRRSATSPGGAPAGALRSNGGVGGSPRHSAALRGRTPHPGDSPQPR